jgi:nucleotidyltransferase/DNA polymerase involved in DNA repair
MPGISAAERGKILKAHSIGPRMLVYLEEIGIERLSDLKGASASEIVMRIDIVLGTRRLNKFGVEAVRNVIALADAERQGL